MYVSVCMLSRFSRVQLFATVACQAPLSMGFSRQGYWSRLPCPPGGEGGGIFLTQGSNMHLLHWQVDSLPLAPPGKPRVESSVLKSQGTGD